MKLDNIERFLLEKKIKTIVVHGLVSSNHTHQYIHDAIYKTFEYILNHLDLDIKLLWCNDDEYSYNIYDLDTNYLIFSSPHYNTDMFLPIIKNAYYILHYRTHNKVTNTIITKYNELLRDKKAVKYIEYRGGPNGHFNKSCVRFLENNFFWRYYRLPKDQEIDDIDDNRKNNYTFLSQPTNELHMSWATNIFPEDIDKNIQLVKDGIKLIPQSYFCGTVWKTNINEVNNWKTRCLMSKLNCIFEQETDELEHERKIRESLISPSFQGASQRESDKWFYIPCRIFKNISYGSLGISNNPGVRLFFGDFLLIYDNNIQKLFKKSLEYRKYIEENQSEYIEEMVEVMEFVRDHHTYLNRIDALIQFGFY